MKCNCLINNENWFFSIHDKKGDYVSVSENVTNLIGYDTEELIGTSAYDYFNPISIRDITASHIGPNMSIVDYQLRKKDGSYIYLKTLSFKNIDNTDRLYCMTRQLKMWELFYMHIDQSIKYLINLLNLK